MNSFGHSFRIEIFGESHGESTGIVIDGCPPGIPVKQEDFKEDLLRRKSGAKGTTQRIEEDIPIIISGIYNGYTTGSPVTILFQNKNIISSDYNLFNETPRPGHADFVASKKYKGFNDPRGSGHFSGRLTTGLVAAGTIAKKIIYPAKIIAKIIEAGGIENINEAVENVLQENDSIGGIIECCISDIGIGLGEPFFYSAESVISHIIFSIPAVKAIEFGAGFKSAGMKGSQHNDIIISRAGKTSGNNSGGINGGITNGNDIIFRVAVKPASSIGKVQNTMNMKTGMMENLKIKGRHDLCIALRMPVIIEAATAIALADLKLI